MNITDTWLQIGIYIDDGSYKTRYSIGDIKELDVLLGGERKTIQMQIAAFDEDMLFDEPRKAPITWISKHIIAYHHMNENSTNKGGWMLSSMRNFCAEVLYKGILDENAKSLIKAARKTSYHYETKYAHTTKDYCWIPSHREVFGDTKFEKNGVTYSQLFENEAHIRYGVFEDLSWWWLRSSGEFSTVFRHVRHNGESYDNRAKDDFGIVLGFCT